jgi:hypothetical protein
MSLSFVASAVQTETTGGGYEETPIESKQVDAVNARNLHKPLFEQLRENQEEEQAKQDEAQRDMMRGTCALDEDDVAHLDALEKQRLGRETEIQQRTREELALFRAARAERQQISWDDDDNDDEEEENPVPTTTIQQPPPVETAAPSPGPVVPKIVVRKRKLRRVQSKEESAGKTKPTKKLEETPKAPETKPTTGLGSLLSGYGSSDDESDQ